MEWMPTRSGPRPHTEPTPRRFEGTALYGPAVAHWKASFSALTVDLSSAHTEPIKRSTDIAKIFKSHSRSTRLLVEALIFNTRWMNFSWVPSNDEGNHQGQSWFQHVWRFEQFAFHGTPHNFLISNATQIHILHYQTEPNSIGDSQIGTSNVIHGTKRWCQRSRQAPKRRGSSSEVVSACTLGWLQEIQAVRVPWYDCLLEPSEDRVEGHCKKKAARWTALSYTSGHKEVSPSCSRDFHVLGAVVKNTSQDAADNIKQFCLLNHGKDSRVIDAGIGGSKFRQQDA